jgi:hypothetical protein
VSPWFELRRDELANGEPNRAIRKNITWLGAAVVSVLVALSSAWWIRASQLQQRFTEITQQQRDIFQQTFPESRIPRAVVSRLESEHVKMIRSRQLTDEVPRSHSALDVLHEFLLSLRTDVRSRTTEIWIDNGVVTADVELRAHDDAGALAASLEQNGFIVDPPTTTQRDKQTVVTRLRARWVPKHEDAAAPSLGPLEEPT